jgi:hypothetical protein
MREIKSEIKRCMVCMLSHRVTTVVMEETEFYKGEYVTYEAVYEYCSFADGLLETEDMIRANLKARQSKFEEIKEQNRQIERGLEKKRVALNLKRIERGLLSSYEERELQAKKAVADLLCVCTDEDIPKEFKEEAIIRAIEFLGEDGPENGLSLMVDILSQ